MCSDLLYRSICFGLVRCWFFFYWYTIRSPHKQNVLLRQEVNWDHRLRLDQKTTHTHTHTSHCRVRTTGSASGSRGDKLNQTHTTKVAVHSQHLQLRYTLQLKPPHSKRTLNSEPGDISEKTDNYVTLGLQYSEWYLELLYEWHTGVDFRHASLLIELSVTSPHITPRQTIIYEFICTYVKDKCTILYTSSKQ